MKIRVWKSSRRNSPFLIVFYNEDTGQYQITDVNDKAYNESRSLICSFRNMPGGLFGASREMGDTLEEVKANIRKAMDEEKQQQIALSREAEEREELARQEAQRKAELRKSIAYTKDHLSVLPIDLMANAERREELLEQLKPGEYYVCINYKKMGIVELKLKARSSNSINVLGKVINEQHTSKAALHRFAKAVKDMYENNTELIGRTHAIQRFGAKLVDRMPVVMERRNLYYSTAAPRRIYDKNTLLWWQVTEYEAKNTQDE